MSVFCPQSPMHRHSAQWTEDGKSIVFTDETRLRALCLYCGVPIQRVHEASSQWHQYDPPRLSHSETAE